MSDARAPQPARDTAFSLRIVSATDASREGEVVEVSRPLIIGRDAVCDVRIKESSVSRQHARVEPADGGVRVVDLDSGNGVWVGNKRVDDAVLPAGEHFRVGSMVFECRPPAGPAEAPAATPEESPEAKSFRVQIVTGGEADAAGTEFVVDGPSVTIGRSAECAIRLNERDLSRQHARLDFEPDGIHLTDLDSSCGTWVDNREITTALIRPGQPFRLGGHLVLQCLAAGEPVEAESPREPEADATRHVPVETPAAEPPAAAARTTVPDEDATRYVTSEPAAAAGEAAAGTQPDDGDATRYVDVADAGSTRAIPEADAAGGAAGTDVSDEDFGRTVVMPVPASLIAATWRVEDEGEPLTLGAHDAFLLNDPDHAWYVVRGGIMIFTVSLEKGEPVGTRSHFLGVVPGQLLFGFDAKRYASASGFLAVPKQGTQLRKIPVSRLRQLAAEPGRGQVVSELVDSWIGGLSTALIANLQLKRTDEPLLKAGARVALDQTMKATSADPVVWINLWSGSVLFNDMTTPRFTERGALFPITPQSWIQPVSEEFGPISVRPVLTRDVIGSTELWSGLSVFHQVLCECEFISKKLALADEFVRLQQKARHAEAAQEAAYDAIGSVMSSEGSTPEEFRATGDSEPVLQACQLVCRTLGMEAKPHPAAEEGLTYEERVSSIATASGFRTRVVVLRDRWYAEDNGPLLGQRSDTKNAIALLPKGPAAYEATDPKTGERRLVDAKLAESMSGFAYAFYRPFPDGELRLSDLIRLGARGIKTDLRWVLVMAVVVGLFGTVTPFLTGRVFDSAIPQADRTMLIGFGAALIVAAAAGAAFKFTQGVATIRIQTRMTAVIQSAVWDRILNLPTNFFRKYSAGDLADRAQGVDAIQNLVAGAGVAAVLGSVSGLFYVVQMFTFNLRLALLAILLTAIYVGFNLVANYLQLRYQRIELQLRGRITGLVLNLLTGVTKIRVCGAENHAFRVWAEQFARQRRISFTVGTIQNVATVFTVVYPVISSIAIFATMVSIQQGATANAERMSTGEFIAFNAAYGLFLMAMQALGDASLNLLRIVPIYERLKPILTTKPEVDATKAFPGKLKGRIELSHVFFRYDPDGPWIIKDVSLVIEPGEFVAFVGSSGGGKSTLLRLMLGFEQPTRGSVLYDGQDLNSLDMRMVRQQLGVVLQTSRVMPTEIYRNIVGVTSRTIEDAWEAAERAGLGDDIRNMPMGMHTYVSEGGGTLSGGQRQRLMIARAIVNKPKILFLDEATSALDNRAQAIVTESMDRMDATRIVIAHRLSTVINANRICYLHGGSVAEVGSHAELMAKDGLFAQLARRQMA